MIVVFYPLRVYSHLFFSGLFLVNGWRNWFCYLLGTLCVCFLLLWHCCLSLFLPIMPLHPCLHIPTLTVTWDPTVYVAATPACAASTLPAIVAYVGVTLNNSSKWHFKIVKAQAFQTVLGFELSEWFFALTSCSNILVHPCSILYKAWLDCCHKSHAISHNFLMSLAAHWLNLQVLICCQ